MNRHHIDANVFLIYIHNENYNQYNKIKDK